MEDLFYVYYTDVQHVVDVNAAADVSKYIDEAKGYSDIQQSIKSVFDVNGKVYGVPRTNYSMGIIYNKALFKKAGLDPDKAPTTWDEVRADAKKISALGKGYVGYADYSAQNQGGWHFTAEMYANGGSMVSADGKKSTVDSAAGKQVLTNLKKMRWDDNSMGSKQLLTINDVQQMMGSGKLGMYLAAPDNIPIIVKQFKGSYDNLAIGAMPGGQGTLLGGDGYMFNKHDTPAQIKAGMKWLQYEYLTPAKGLNDYQRAAGEKAPVGLPEPNLWVGSTAATDNAAKKKYANVPTENYSQFTNGSAQLTGKLEPPQAQQQYSVLDSVMSAVLTNKNANINQLLSDAQNKINGILAHGS
jgi:multiple sugar transport system substrate-binding protein